MTATQSVPIFINGEWQSINSVATTPVFNPSTGEQIAATPMGNASHVDAAVQAAAAAFPAWMETPAVERARIMFKFRMLMEENFEELVRCNTRDHGKTLVE